MPWTGWQQLNGGYSGGIEAIGQNADGRLEVFGLQPAPGGQSIAHNWQTAPNSGWNGWAGLGSPPHNDVLSHVEAASDADGRLEAFVRYGAMSAGAMWHTVQTAPNNGWSGWTAINVGTGHVTAGPIVVAANADGRLELFAVGSPDGITHAWQTAPGAGTWAQGDLGSPTGGIFVQNVAAGRNADGRLSVFAQGSDGAIWSISQTAPNNGWGSWASLGKPSSDTVGIPAVGANADGRLEVFASGTSAAWHTWQSSPGGGFGSWASLGLPAAGGITGLSVGQNADGRQEVFATVGNGDVWHIWQTSPNNGWSAWDDLRGEPAPGVLVGRNQDGRLEVFVNGRSGGVYHRWQTSPGGTWS